MLIAIGINGEGYRRPLRIALAAGRDAGGQSGSSAARRDACGQSGAGGRRGGPAAGRDTHGRCAAAYGGKRSVG